MLRKNVVVFLIFVGVFVQEGEFSTDTREKQSLSVRASPPAPPSWMKRIGSNYAGYPGQVSCALKHLTESYNTIKSSKFSRNCDRYFRCRGNKRAAECGLFSKLLASAVSYDHSWRSAGRDRYTSEADRFGRLGGNCVSKYVYKTFRTNKECWLTLNDL